MSGQFRVSPRVAAPPGPESLTVLEFSELVPPETCAFLSVEPTFTTVSGYYMRGRSFSSLGSVRSGVFFEGA